MNTTADTLLNTIADIVEAFGGATSLARIIKRPMPTVAGWKRRNSIPASEWMNIVHAARDLRIPLKYEDLARISAAAGEAA